MAYIGDIVRDRVNNLLPRVLKKTEEKLGYTLPKVKLTNIMVMKVSEHDYNFYIDGVVSKKDGTFGQLKRLVSITVESVIQGSGYGINQIYYTYKRGDFEV